MSKFFKFDPHIASLLVGALLLFSQQGTAQGPTKQPSRPNIGTSIPHSFSVSGMVSDAESHTKINGVRVELRSFTGGTVASGFTSGDGNFQIENVAQGSYQVVVDEMGYQTASQRVDVEGPVSGLYIELRVVHSAGTMVSGSPTVSTRELSIPRKARDDMGKGLALMNGKSDYQGSIKDFQRAIQEYQDYHEAYAQMGVAYLHLGNNASSEQALRKSLELSQNKDVDALFWLATLMSDASRFADAEILAREAVELNPNSWQSNSQLARALLGLNRLEEAEKSAQAAVKLRPDNPVLYLIQANIHEQLQDDAALLDDLNNYLKLAPSGPFAGQVRQQKEQVQQELGNAQGAPASPPSK
jgi:Carboxypeptidase regulatory-like domain/Tetratricopeptide repeat